MFFLFGVFIFLFAFCLSVHIPSFVWFHFLLIDSLSSTKIGFAYKFHGKKQMKKLTKYFMKFFVEMFDFSWLKNPTRMCAQYWDLSNHLSNRSPHRHRFSDNCSSQLMSMTSSRQVLYVCIAWKTDDSSVLQLLVDHMDIWKSTTDTN